MAEEIRVVEHYSASILNKVGEGALLLGALRDAGVNLIALQAVCGEGGRYGAIVFLPPAAAGNAASVLAAA